MSEKVYSRVPEAEEIIVKLCEEYKDVFWAVRPEIVAVVGVENKTRGKKAVEKMPFYSKIKTITGPERKIIADSGVKIRYIIELYWSDWSEWKESQKQWVLAENILQIGSEVGKTVKHDCIGFKILLDIIGVEGVTNKKEIPNLLLSHVDFNLDLRPGLDDLEEPIEKDEIEDEPEVTPEDDKGDDDTAGEDESENPDEIFGE